MKAPLAMLLFFVVTSPAHAGESALCRPGFDVAEPATVAGRIAHRRATVTSDTDACTFRVRLCPNLGKPACVPRSLDRLVARGLDASPSASTTSDECGPWTTVTVPVVPNGTTRRRLRAAARDAGGRRLRARITLRCDGVAPVDRPVPVDPPVTPGDARECEGISTRDAGRQVDFPPSLPILSCSDDGTSSNYLTPEAQIDDGASEELHVVSVYEGELPGGAQRGFQEHPRGRIDVTVRARPKPIVLYLGSYERELWALHLEPGAQLSRILTFGYYDQDVQGAPAGVPVTALSYDDGVSCMYGWEPVASSGGCPFRPTMLRIRELTGLVESSFQGCYGGRAFVVPQSDGPPPQCPATSITGDEHRALRDVALPGCEALTTESRHCLTTAGGALAVLGMDSGTVCTLPAGPFIQSFEGGFSPTLAWRGEAVYACPYGVGLVRASLVDGTVERANVPCDGVAVARGRLLVAVTDPADFFARSLLEFDSWDDVIAGRPVATYPGGWTTRFAVAGGVFYFAWHSTDTISRFDMASGVALADVKLQDYDGWILGLSATGDGRLVIPGDIWGATVRVFDASTGALEKSLDVSTPVEGIACVDAR